MASFTTYSNSNPITNGNNSFVNTVRRARYCSFCNNQGHYVNNCNDERLMQFHELLIAKRDNLMIRHNGSLHISLQDFEDWLFYQEREIIRAYAIRFCGALARHSGNDYCNSIMMKIFNIPGIDEFYDIMRYMREVIRDMEFIPFTQENNRISVQSILIDSNVNENENKFCIKIQNDMNEKMTEVIECSICYDTTNETQNVRLNCGHEYCGKCIINSLKLCATDIPSCAMCRTEIVNIKCKNNEIKEELCKFIF